MGGFSGGKPIIDTANPPMLSAWGQPRTRGT